MPAATAWQSRWPAGGGSVPVRRSMGWKTWLDSSQAEWAIRYGFNAPVSVGNGRLLHAPAFKLLAVVRARGPCGGRVRAAR